MRLRPCPASLWHTARQPNADGLQRGCIATQTECHEAAFLCNTGEHAPGAVLVRFADYEDLPDDLCCGHPQGLEWFCPAHAPAARALAHLALPQAVALMREGRGA